MRLTIGVSGSAAGNINEKLKKTAFIIGQEIAQKRAILMTGACPGLSFQAARGAKSKGGFVIGISPAENKKEHEEVYYKEFIQKDEYSTKYFDLIVYTGFGFKGRNPVFIRSCNGVICLSGRIGTLNEFTIAYDERRPIGVLQPGGISGLIPKIIKVARKGNTRVIYDTDPKKLVLRLTEILKKQRVKKR